VLNLCPPLSRRWRNAQIGEIGRNAHGRAGGPQHEFVRREFAAVTVEPVGEPSVQGIEPAARSRAGFPGGPSPRRHGTGR
jgi:hypothetical protein